MLSENTIFSFDHFDYRKVLNSMSILKLRTTRFSVETFEITATESKKFWGNTILFQILSEKRLVLKNRDKHVHFDKVFR